MKLEISVIIPCYNALGKIERCLTSLRKMDIPNERFEIVFVDDCSTDGTYDYLTLEAQSQSNWRVLQLDKNSGSPSKPRNHGTKAALGDYVFFLDCDDEILPDTLSDFLAFALEKDACIVRGYLIADDGNEQVEMNKISNWRAGLSKKERIELIIGKQSTIPCSLIKRSVILDHNIRWSEDIRMGEDSCFLADVLIAANNIEYFSHPTYIYNKKSSFTASSTQTYGALELENHLFVWNYLYGVLAKVGIDYFTLRLKIGLQTALKSLIYHNKYDVTESLFQKLSQFFLDNHETINSFNFNQRIEALKRIIMSGDYATFCNACKPRLLIAGYDLKFILPVIDQLSQFYDVKIDEWPGHNHHNEAESEKLLGWADYIWCEWLLGNAVWYSQRKQPYQKLVVRMHRFELGREFGDQINVNNIDAVVSVSLLFFERLLERFPNIPRTKARLIHNYVDISGYDKSTADERRFNIGLIGIVPYRKGLHHGIEILKQLKQHDSRYRLKIFGKSPQDIPWLQKHVDEMEYYAKCDAMIAEHNLTDSVEYLGFCNIKKALAENEVGFVLSVSENTKGFPGPESFHLAIADGFAAGAVSLILNWDGCEYIYSDEYIKDSVEQITQSILSLPEQPTQYGLASTKGEELMHDKYSTDEFVRRFVQTFNEV